MERKKLDLHRHAGGSVKPETVWKLMKRDNKLDSFADNLDDLYYQMTFRDDTKYKFHRFLNKFSILNHIRWDEEAIDLTVEQIVRDLHDEGIEYCELRFSIDKYLGYIPWDETEACLYFLGCLAHHSKNYNVKVGPVLSIKHESSWIQAKRISKLINHWRVADQLVGLDIVGNEAMFNRKKLRNIYRYWRGCGKGLLIHAGETQGPENVKLAIKEFHVQRVAHGISCIQDPETVAVAIDHGIVFDVALTSNYMTGIVENMKEHPVKEMLDRGCTITIGTDDPVQFCTTLDREYDILADVLGVDLESSVITNIYRNSEIHALQT